MMNADKATSPATSIYIHFSGSGDVIWIGEEVGGRLTIPYQPPDPVPDLTLKQLGISVSLAYGNDGFGSITD